MAEIHARHWHRRTSGWSLRAAIVFSVAVHLAVFSLALINWRSAQPKAIPISFDMQFVSPPTPNPDPEAKPTKAPPPPPKKVEPKPEKKKEEPKKEPEKKPEKKPEPKPEKPKKKEPEKKPEKKVEKKAEPEKPKKKEPEKKSEPVPTQSKMPAPEVVAKTPPPSAGVQQQQLPPMLNMWGRQVQRKVEKYWSIPGGIPLTPENREVQITFWVQRDGTLLSQPTTDRALDSALVQSCIQAIVNAQPLPPLPLEFVGDRQQVVYVFSLTDSIAAGGGTG